MLSRILSRTQLRLISLSISNSYTNCSTQIPKYPFFRHFSSNNNDGYDPNHPAANIWRISEQPMDDLDDIFGSSGGTEKTDPFESEKPNTNPAEGGWVLGKSEAAEVLWSTRAESEMPKPKTNTSPAVGPWVLGENDVGEDLWATEGVGEGRVVSSEGDGFKPWNLAEEEEGKEQKEKELLEIDDIVVEEEDEKTREEREMREAAEEAEREMREAAEEAEREMREAAEKVELEKEKESLLEVIQGPNRAFGDLIAASGITDDMLDSLIALKNFQDIEGLPPLSQIEDERYLKTIQKSSRHEMELQKQEDAAKARVRKVDEQGRAYGTGKRKTSIARVWIQPGEGKFIVNDKEIDVYFPILDHRATILRPFSETKTLGLWDVRCTVKGGGTTGQTGALRLGISRALQNWEPGFRPPLKEAGFLTRDPRIVERKKPGKAKARKSFQWVKR